MFIFGRLSAFLGGGGVPLIKWNASSKNRVGSSCWTLFLREIKTPQTVHDDCSCSPHIDSNPLNRSTSNAALLWGWLVPSVCAWMSMAYVLFIASKSGHLMFPSHNFWFVVRRAFMATQGMYPRHIATSRRNGQISVADFFILRISQFDPGSTPPQRRAFASMTENRGRGLHNILNSLPWFVASVGSRFA